MNRLKELLIVSYFEYPSPVGLSVRISGLSQLLMNHGIKVKVLSPRLFNCKQDLLEAQKKSYELECMELGLTRDQNSNNLHLKFLQWSLFSLFGSFKVAKYYLKNRCLIQYQSLYSFFPAFFAKFFLKAKIVGDDIVIFNNFLDGFLLKFTDFVITPSSRTQSFCKMIKKPSLYVPNGVNKLFEPSNQKQTFNLLFVGALSFDQNFEAVKKIVRVAEILEAEKVRFEVVIIGGPLSCVEKIIKHELVQKGRIKFTGRVSRQVLEDFSKNSFIGLLPFFSDTPLMGGQRTKALDFFAHGLLVISGPEGVKGIHGLEPNKHYLHADTLDEFCTILVNCLLKPKKYESIAKNGAHYVLNNYSWEVLADQYSDLVEKLLANNFNSST